ncbi:MAG: KEOPS complex subunit Pcc1 [Nitrososphaeria archaeon]
MALEKITVDVQLENDERYLKSLMRALEPDNVNFPEGIEMSMKYSNGALVIHAESDERRIMSLLNTLDEVLELAKMIERGVD